MSGTCVKCQVGKYCTGNEAPALPCEVINRHMKTSPGLVPDIKHWNYSHYSVIPYPHTHCCTFHSGGRLLLSRGIERPPGRAVRGRQVLPRRYTGARDLPAGRLLPGGHQYEHGHCVPGRILLYALWRRIFIVSTWIFSITLAHFSLFSSLSLFRLGFSPSLLRISFRFSSCARLYSFTVLLSSAWNHLAIARVQAPKERPALQSTPAQADSTVLFVPSWERPTSAPSAITALIGPRRT